VKTKKAVTITARAAKKERKKPFYYYDENRVLWIGFKSMIYRIDEGLVFSPEAWKKQNMDVIICRSKDVEETRMTGICIDSPTGKENIKFRLFISGTRLIWVNQAYLEPLETDDGTWLSEKNEIHLVDECGKVKAVLAGLLNSAGIHEDLCNDFLKIAEVLKNEEGE